MAKEVHAQFMITLTAARENATGERPGTSYMASKCDSRVVVAPLSPEFTARTAKRWH
jgi:hypothetical protein